MEEVEINLKLFGQAAYALVETVHHRWAPYRPTDLRLECQWTRAGSRGSSAPTHPRSSSQVAVLVALARAQQTCLAWQLLWTAQLLWVPWLCLLPWRSLSQTAAGMAQTVAGTTPVTTYCARTQFQLVPVGAAKVVCTHATMTSNVCVGARSSERQLQHTSLTAAWSAAKGGDRWKWASGAWRCDPEV